MLAVASSTRQEVLLSNSASDAQKHIVTAHSGGTFAVALSPDGALLASAGQDRSWKLWDVQSGENLLAVLMQNSWGDCTCLTRSGTRMIVNFSCPVWGHSSVVISFSFAEPRWRVATGGMDKAVLLWNMHSGALEHRLLGHSGGVGSVAFSPDGVLLASGGVRDGHVLLWDTVDGGGAASSLILGAHLDGSVTAIGGSIQSPWLRTDAHWQVQLWSIDGNRGSSSSGAEDRRGSCETHVLEGIPREAVVRAVAFSADSDLVAAGCMDACIRVCVASTGKLRITLWGHNGEGDCSCGRTQYSSEGCSVIGHRGGVSSLAFSPSSDLLASGALDWTCRLWDVCTGKVSRLVKIGGAVALPHCTAQSLLVSSLAFGRDVARDEICAAFAMGQHARLGRSSWASEIEAGVARMILDLV